MRNASLLIMLLTLLDACSGVEQQDMPESSTDFMVSPSNKFIYTDDQDFMKPNGEPLIIKAINIGYRYHEENGSWSLNEGIKDFQKIHDLGFNAIKLNFSWSQVEPECGLFDSVFVKDLRQKVVEANKSGLYVILGMTQFLWGEGIPDGHGAPIWALIKTDTVHRHNGYHPSTAYVESPLIHTAFDNFWENTPAKDGKGLIDHYADSWKLIARMFNGDSLVLGYQIINDPFLGSSSAELTRKAVIKRMLPLTIHAVPVWRLSDFQVYYAALKDVEKDTLKLLDHWLAYFNPQVRELEEQWLMPFYTTIGSTIREVDKSHIIFTEMSQKASEGAIPGIRRIKYKSGQFEKQQAVSATLYDEKVDKATFRLNRLWQTSHRLHMPLFVSEWGKLDNFDNYYEYDPVPATKNLTSAFKGREISSSYWEFRPDLESESYYPVIHDLLID
jgi:endoglycosylceramidase